MAYSSADIKNFINGQGIGNNPWAIYANAQKYGVGADQVDSAMGWGAGTSANWMKQNGVNLSDGGLGLNGGKTYTGQDIKNFVNGTGIGNDPWAMYGNAQKYGIGADQLDSAMGWQAGTSNNWIKQNGLNPLGGAQQGMGAAAGGILSANSYPGANGNRTQYGYNQNPTQNGYYQQDTPMGSFAGASTNQANAYQASNPYIGATSQGIAGVGNVGTATAGANPYIGQTTQGVNYQASQGAGANPYAGQNSYLNGAIDANAADMTRNFNRSVMPQIDRMAQQSGSFGNTGVQGVQQDAFRDLNNSIGNMSNSMRMQDYGMQQGLAENSLNRTQANNQFNAGNLLNAGQFNSSLQAGDLNRNLGATAQAGMFNAGQINDMGKYNAGNTLNTQQFNSTLGNNDLARNSGLAQNMGQFNSGALNTNSMFNAGQANATNQFNAGSANNMIQRNMDRNMAMDQFGQNMDFNVWRANTDNMRNGTNDTVNFLNTLLNWQGLGTGAATNVQNTPMNYWQQFAQGAGNLGGVGGTVAQTGNDSKNLQGNPLLGGIGGYQLWNALFGGGK